MRFFKLILISIVILCIATLFVFSLFPSHIRVSRVIDIHAPGEKIYAAINDCNAWSQWNEFINQSKTNKIISSPSSGAGATIQYEGMRITIVSANPDSVTTRWVQKDNKEFTGGFNMVKSQDETIVVEWYFNFNFRWYPWEKLGSMFYDKQLGPVMEKSLINLKNYTENR